MKRLYYKAKLAVCAPIMLVLLLVAGCGSIDLREEAKTLRVTYGVYHDNVVPAPDLSEENKEKTKLLGEEIERLLDNFVKAASQG